MFLITKDDQLDLISVLISTYMHYEQWSLYYLDPFFQMN